MRARETIVAVGLAMVCLGATSGCGVIVQLTSSPDVVSPGAPVTFGIKLTNPSQCPVGDVTANLDPFIPEENLIIEGDPEIVDFIRFLILVACSGAGFELPEDIVCDFVDGVLVCELEDALTTGGTSGEATVRSGDTVLFSCERQGSRYTCEAGARRLSGALTLLQQTLTCGPGVDHEQECSLALLPGGEMATATLVLPAPADPGRYFNILMGQAFTRGGVCKNTGAPCSVDLNCPGGAMDVCGSGICRDDDTDAPGNGCDVDLDCPSTSHCVQCALDESESTFPFACTQTTVRLQAQSPPMSWWSFAAAAFAVVLVQAFGWHRRRRA